MVTDKNGEIELKKMDVYYLKSDLSFHYKKNRELIVDLLRIKHLLKLNGKISAEEISILELGLRHSWYEIYNQIAGLIVSQFYTYLKIQELCLQLMKDKHSKIRCNIFEILLFKLKKSVSNEFIKKALEDKSIRVVEVGIEYIELNDLANFIPELNKLKNKFPKNKKSIENSINFISNGYITEEDSENPDLVWITLKHKNTYHSRSFQKKIVTNKLISSFLMDIQKTL
ncbi:MAG: hypothetical protein KBF42_03710 [Chitinophagales bacterium]|jgi:hypothetical protein|nr:hypothetical protein [Bacteroidota bacterium]MBP8916730.1 hypothetical protein [Chitinophagales bacterium]MBP9220465.1 hypothetical protein [Chitinophagales bacterium]MBP9795124.1 hypothetical protein [Chitinophagales bacterium]